MKRLFVLFTIAFLVMPAALWAAGGAEKAGPGKIVAYVLDATESSQAARQEVDAAANQILGKKLNITVEWKRFDWSYGEKLQLAIAAKEDFDTFFTCYWVNEPYSKSALDESLAALDDLLPKYGPWILKNRATALDMARINGKIYAVPGKMDVNSAGNFYIVKEMAEKYKIDTSGFKTWADIEKIATTLKAEKDFVPLRPWTGVMGFYPLKEMGIENTNLRFVAYDVKNKKIIRVQQKPEYAQYYKMVRRWAEEGLMGSKADLAEMAYEKIQKNSAAGKYLMFSQEFSPKIELMQQDQAGRSLVPLLMTDDIFLQPNAAWGTMQAVPAWSKNKERAVAYLNELASNPDLYNLLAYGIKDKHYTVSGKGDATPIDVKKGGYASFDWMWGLNPFGLTFAPQTRPKWSYALGAEKTLKPALLAGFIVDPDKYQNEIANLDPPAFEALATQLAIGWPADGKSSVEDLLAQMDQVLKEYKWPAFQAQLQKDVDAFLSAKK